MAGEPYNAYETTMLSSEDQPSPDHRSRRLRQLLATMSGEAVGSGESLILPSGYLDIGDREHVCEYCGAFFWFPERLLSAPRRERPKYNVCCRGGAVRFPFSLQPPSVIKDLFAGPQFMENVREYNIMFSMTSFGTEDDDTVNDGRCLYVFKVSGQVSHWLGSFCLSPNEEPWFLQMYLYDTDNEVSNRMRFFSSASRPQLSADVVSAITETLRLCNEYVKLFRSVIDLCVGSDAPDFSIRLHDGGGKKTYQAPAPGTLGAILRDNEPDATMYDIGIHSKDGTPQRVSKLHSSYMPLQYPLLFPFAEQGWSPSLRLHTDMQSEDKKLTMNMYYSYQIHDRVGIYALLLHGGRLFQQYLVDVYVCMEQCRLEYIAANQNLFHCKYLRGIHDALSRGDTEGHHVGRRTILPLSFTGGPRYMYKHYQDALAICRVHGNPQYFITFTCNAQWPEIRNHLDKVGCAHAQDRPDIIAHVFQMKVEEFIKCLKTKKSIRRSGSWICEATTMDEYITVEIPNPYDKPAPHKIVTDYMIHDPCGLPNEKASCMRDGSCSKSFPKPFEGNTRFDKDGYLHYKRRPDGQCVIKNGVPLDNGYVVPYNKNLCKYLNTHINVEYCGWNMMIKYLFKYISNGVDRIWFTITKIDDVSPCVSTQPPVNEIKKFVDGRFICPHEAAWRILNFPIHNINPVVQVPAVHLEDMQNVTF